VLITVNGRVILNDHDGQAIGRNPLAFNATSGDILRIVASNTFPPHQGFSPLYLFRPDNSSVQVLDPDGFDEFGDDLPVGVFYDQSFTISI
jgi:hypothetical protein